MHSSGSSRLARSFDPLAEAESEPSKPLARSQKSSTPYTVLAVEKPGSVYAAFLQELLKRNEWSLEVDPDWTNGSYDLVLGEACGMKVEWKRLGADKKRKSLALVNYYRNHRFLCRKDEMTLTLREHCERVRLEMGRIAPETYVFKAGEAGRTEIESEMLRLGFWRQAKRGKGTIWIVKPSDGQKGEGIQLCSTLPQLDTVVTGEKRRGVGTSAGTVVQKYVERPLLLTGGRKFDLRCWVLVDWRLNVYVFQAGVLRVTATPYSLTNEDGELTLDNLHMHLSNHCIAEKHEDFGKWEPTNELWYDDLDAILAKEFPEHTPTTASHILPAMEAIIVQTVVASREELIAGLPQKAKTLCGVGAFEGQAMAVDTIGSFNLFGYFPSAHLHFPSAHLHFYTLHSDSHVHPRYDFMIADDLQVQLIEVNSSPAVAEALLPALVQELIKVLVDPIFPPMPQSPVQSAATIFEKDEDDALRQSLKQAAKEAAKYAAKAAVKDKKVGGGAVEAKSKKKSGDSKSDNKNRYPSKFRLLTQVRTKTESECRAGGKWATPLDGRYTIRRRGVASKSCGSDGNLLTEIASAEEGVERAAASWVAAEQAGQRSAELLSLAKGHAARLIQQSRAGAPSRSYGSGNLKPGTAVPVDAAILRGTDHILRFSKKGSDNASSAVFSGAPPTDKNYCRTGRDKRGGDKTPFLPSLHQRKVQDESERMKAQEVREKAQEQKRKLAENRRKTEEQKHEDARKRKQKRRQQVLLRHLMNQQGVKVGEQPVGAEHLVAGEEQEEEEKRQQEQKQRQREPKQQQQKYETQKAMSKYKMKLAQGRKLKADHRAIEAEYIAKML
jgi:tubulin--tyrosine ligase